MREDQSPRNLAGTRFTEVTSISVNEYHPLPDGKGKPEQVHLYFEIKGYPFPFVVRFKSRRPVDNLIVALLTHANGVWPKPKKGQEEPP